MTANAETLPTAKNAAPKRRFRNFLLNPRFQLKYTGAVVLVTVVVAGALGYFAYRYSTEMTETVTANELAMAMTPEAQQLLLDESEQKDRQVLMSIISGIFILGLALGFTGIIVTHKIVGPSLKMRLLIGDVADGHMRIKGRLRKGDELQDVFDAFERMVNALRQRQQDEIDLLDHAIQASRDAGTPEEALQDIVEVRERMAEQLK